MARRAIAYVLDLVCGLTDHGWGTDWWNRHVCRAWGWLADE